MDTNQTNSRSTPENEMTAGDTAVQKAESSSRFKRNLVPLHEYATRQGISNDIVEQQGQLGIIQIRKFKGQKFVVDVSPEELSEFENENIAGTVGKPLCGREGVHCRTQPAVLQQPAVVRRPSAVGYPGWRPAASAICVQAQCLRMPDAGGAAGERGAMVA